eukprot:SAG22_NODE_2345_length_2685_cov_2.129544_2_plen_309_part_00
MHNWQVGAALAFLASVIAAAGDNLVKLSYTRDSSALFALGWFLSIVVSVALTLVAYGLASVALLAPFGGLRIASNIFLAHYVNKEPLACSDIWRTLLVLAGLTVVLVLGPKENPRHALPALVGLYQQPVFLLYAAAMAVLTAGLLAARRLGGRRTQRASTAALSGCFASFSNLCVRGGRAQHRARYYYCYYLGPGPLAECAPVLLAVVAAGQGCRRACYLGRSRPKGCPVAPADLVRRPGDGGDGLGPAVLAQPVAARVRRHHGRPDCRGYRVDRLHRRQLVFVRRVPPLRSDNLGALSCVDRCGLHW